MSHFEKYITDGNEKADELEGAMWDEGLTSQARADTVQQERRNLRSLAVWCQL